MHTPIEFTPAVPLPRRTLSEIMATGAGRAEFGRLFTATMVGTFGALAVLLVMPAWWIVSTPLICVAAFAGWGIAARKTLELDRRHLSAPSLRLSLQFVRVVAASTGALAALTGLFGTLALLLQRS